MLLGLFLMRQTDIGVRQFILQFKDVRGWQFLTMKASATLCIVCLPPEGHTSWKKYLGNRPSKKSRFIKVWPSNLHFNGYFKNGKMNFFWNSSLGSTPSALLTWLKNYCIIGRSENKTLTKCSSYENKVRPGVVMTSVFFSLFAGCESLSLGYCSQIWPPYFVRTRITTTVNENPCNSRSNLVFKWWNNKKRFHTQLDSRKQVIA